MYDFVVLGGDMRQAYLADLLMKQGYKVGKFLVPDMQGMERSAQEAVKGQAYAGKEEFLLKLNDAEAVLAPVPIAIDNMQLNQAQDETGISLHELSENMKKDQILFGGRLPNWFIEQCREKGCRCYDYMLDDTIAVRNAVATAEGIIAEAVMKYPGNIHGTRCLVLGFGRCGKVLAEKLKGLSAKVGICVRKDADAAWAKALGYEAVFFDCSIMNAEDCTGSRLDIGSKGAAASLSACIGSYPLLFNTVPYMVLNRELLSKMDRDSMIFDIASAPGGVDYEAAERIGIQAEIRLSLPGLYAPKASAEILAEVVQRVTRKE